MVRAVHTDGPDEDAWYPDEHPAIPSEPGRLRSSGTLLLLVLAVFSWLQGDKAQRGALHIACEMHQELLAGEKEGF